ncbi:MAG: SusC/RagA family TonB-linked outer membrane protein [Janthinobacterium lividum]
MNTRIPSSRPLKGLKWSRLVPLLLLSGGLAPLAPRAAYAQVAGAHTVTGKITSDNGEGIPGVTVVVKGTTTGATTDVNGNYTVTVPDDNSILVFSSVGYTRQEIAVGKRTNLSQSLVPETQALNEVQVVGYGTQKKSQVTGAISTVSDEQLHDVPVANIGQALQGRAAGINVSSASNSPGQAPVIRIRGNRSFAGSNDPLLVVDGVPYDGSINDLNPDDITSLEVLKDASSTAIYGARGANGVILISTRRGKSGAPRATYSGYYGLKKAYGRFDLQNGQQYYNFRRQAYLANGVANPDNSPGFLTQNERDNLTAGNSFDYQDLLYRDGRIQNHSLGVSGGTDITQYSVSLGYYDETGIVPVQGVQRYSLRATLDQQIGKRVKVGLNTLNSYTNYDDPTLNIINGILTSSPLASPYDANGIPILYPNTDTALGNPLNYYTTDAHKDTRRRLRTFNSLYGQVEIVKGLSYRLNLGLTVASENNGGFYASNTPAIGGGQNVASRSQSLAYNILAENLLIYNRSFGKHDLNFTGLYSAQQYSTDGFGTTVRNLPTNFQQDNNLGAGTPSAANSYQSAFSFISYMGRINYAYDNRYSATVTLRYDGSSRLSGDKYKPFPSAAVAWNLANEDFIKDRDWVSNLKLRASLGRVGSTAVAPYSTLGSLQSALGNGYYLFGTTGAIGVVPATIANRNLNWEYTTTTNFGLDFGFFQNRITGSVEVYQQRTTDLLLPDALPAASGYTAYTRNTGITQNRGLEITLTTVNLRPKNPGGFEWQTDWNFTVNREKVVDLGLGTSTDGTPLSDVGNQRFIGQPLYSFFDYKKVGIWQTGEEAAAAKAGSRVGQIKLLDVNGNGLVDPADRVVVGSRQPKFEAGMTQRFRWKGFDLTAVGLTRVGATVIDPLLLGNAYFTTFEGRRNQINLDYWTPTNPTNAFPQPRQGNGDFPPYSQTLAYLDGTFIKVRSIDLGYTIPAAWAKTVFMSSARVYLQVQNPLIWSPVSYFKNNKAIDPDALSYSTRFSAGSANGIAIAEGDLNSGVNSTTAARGVNYPVTRAFIVGVNLAF